MEKIETRNTYEVAIRHGKKIVAHVGCSHFNNEIQIRDLYVLPKFREKGLGEVLLSQVQEYALEKQAERIIAYCGAEPFCEGGQISMDQEKGWYEDHGFIHDHDVLGVTPCMIKELK